MSDCREAFARQRRERVIVDANIIEAKGKEEKVTEGLNFNQSGFQLFARPPPLHLPEPNPVLFFYRRPKPVVTYRLTVMRRLSYQMQILIA